MAEKHHRLNDDLKGGPYGRLDWVGYPLALKHTMRNQFAGSQSRQQIADCRLGGRPSSVPDLDDSLLGSVGDPGERHPKRPVRVIDSLSHRNGLSKAEKLAHVRSPNVQRFLTFREELVPLIYGRSPEASSCFPRIFAGLFYAWRVGSGLDMNCRMQMRLLDQLDDLGLLGSGISHAPSSPCPLMLFLSRRFSRVRSATTSFKAVASRRRCVTSSELPRGPCPPPTGACRPQETP
jgi:hypothetical protein